MARIIRVHRDQAADLTLFQNQASRWKAGPGLTTAQRDAVAGFEAAIGQLRQLNRGAGNNRPVSTATASSFLNAAGRLGG